MKIIKKLNLFYIFITAICFAQEHKFLNYPKFDEADLKKTQSAIEKDAPAEILFNSVRYDIKGGKAEKTFYSKIKIYDKKRAENWLNIEIPVINDETLSDFELNIYNYQDNRVEKKTLNKKDQLKETLVKGVKYFKLAIPNVNDGSVIMYSYKMNTGIFNLTYYLQYDIPVVYQEYNLESPETITYFFNTAGNLIKPQHYVTTSEDRLRIGYNIYRLGYENMKSIQKENFVKNVDRYRSRIKPELTRYAIGYMIYETAESWNKVAERLNQNEHFGGFLKSDIRDNIPENIRTYYDSKERANKIFDFIKNNFKWNKESGIIPSQSLKQIIKTKSGNAADINLLLISALRSAGLEANPLLISTIDNGILNIVSPNINNLDFVIAAVKIDKQFYLFDATSFNSKVNMLPERDWNDFGILIEKDKGTDLYFSNKSISKKELVIKADIDLQNSDIKGTLTKKESGLYAIEAYDSFDDNNDKYNQAFKTDYRVNLKDIESKLLSNGDFESKMNFSSANLMDIVGSKIILNPLLFLNIGNENFDQKEERKNQIDFTSAFTQEKKVEINIPDGYKVADLPKPKKISTDDKEISFSYNIEVANNKLTVISKVDVASQNYPKEYYPFFKQIWKIINESENQVISLIKN
ncbi:transglutaminase-like domain-containing protein [Chryseobacterium sp. VD8]|uniref:transglutaminase-like domain-containing protein n=1 Tax=Chryseobacterium sp. VD8 TaxID=3081254 RepID=UPI0030183740